MEWFLAIALWLSSFFNHGYIPDEMRPMFPEGCRATPAVLDVRTYVYEDGGVLCVFEGASGEWVLKLPAYDNLLGK